MKYSFIPFILLMATVAFSQTRNSYFPEDQLITTGVYYYPEHWDSLQWERDIKNIASLGFEVTA